MAEIRVSKLLFLKEGAVTDLVSHTFISFIPRIIIHLS